MKLENQVASLELCKRLKNLGVRQESAFYWSHNEKECSYSLDSFVRHKEHFAAFTVAELGEMLPSMIDSLRLKPDYGVDYLNGKWTCLQHSKIEVWDDTEANARCLMLIYLIEKGIVDATKIK